MAHIIADTAEFEKEVLGSAQPVLVDFYADWCGPCKALTPTLDALVAKYGDTAKIVKVDVDKNPGLAQQFNVRGIPAIMFFKDGEMKSSLTGVQSQNVLEDEFNKLI